MIFPALMLSTQLSFINERTNEVRKLEAPSSAVVESATASDDFRTFKISFKASGNNTVNQDAQVLEIHLIGENSTVGVVVMQLQGTSTIDPIGQIARRECRFLDRSGKITKITPKILKSGITFELPSRPGVKNWCVVTRWRPATLPASFSPSSVWHCAVSAIFGKAASKQEIPSLASFLKFEFGK